MKALVLEHPETVSIKEVPMSERRQGQALIKISAVSVCGSDISAYHGRGVAVPYPLILGHEVAGVIQEMDDTAGSELKVGDRVILDPYIFCGHCYPCSLGRTNCCESLKVLGVQTDGAMSEYFAHPVSLLHKVPDEIPWELVPLAEPLVIALHGLHRAAVAEGEHVAIIGAGPIGLLAAMAIIQYGAVPILVDIVPERLELGRSLGVKHTLNPKEQDAVESIRQITNGRMAEVVMEMSGSHGGIQNTLDYASYCGRITLTGWPTGETPLMTPLITRKELDVRGARTGAGEFEEALELISSHKIDARAVLTKVVPFEGLPEAIRRQAEEPGNYLKIAALL